MDVFNYNGSAAIVFSCHVNGLGIIRSLGRKGIPVLGLDYESNIGLFSRYCQSMHCPDPKKDKEGFVEFLIKIGPRFRERPVLFPTNDPWLMAISEYREEL